MDERVLQELARYKKLQNPSDNYLTKLDLIDHYPELFDSRRIQYNLSGTEIEYLRSLTVSANNQNEKYQKKASVMVNSEESKHQKKLDKMFKHSHSYQKH